MSKIKITVVKGLTRGEIFGDDIPEHLPDTDPDRRCRYHVVGQEYMSVDHGYPEPVNNDRRFCHWAFADIQKQLVFFDFGNKYYKIGEPHYAACTDGTATVIFQLERTE
jgi:uncharacterized repeat protein (TIGR04076 family)